MSYLARLKREISQNGAKGELTELTKGASVGFVGTAQGASGDISQNTGDQWREFETLLAIVAPAYNTPEHEYAEIREAAAGDMAAALETYRSMAAQVKGI
ncbi:MAG: hypothetical protein ACKO15_04270 [Burkholderiales bacterium]